MFNHKSYASPLASPYSQQAYMTMLNASVQNPNAPADLNNLVTYATSQKPNVTYLATDTPQFRMFVKRLENNFSEENVYKLGACVFCWGFITPAQRKRHQEHTAFLVVPG